MTEIHYFEGMKDLLLKYNNPVVKKHLAITLLGMLLGISIYSYIAYSEEFFEEATGANEYTLVGICGVIVSYTVYFITIWLDKIFSWQKQTGTRLLLGIITNSNTAFAISGLLYFGYTTFYLEENDFLSLHLQTLIKLGIIIFILIFMYSILYFALYSYYLYATAQIESLKQERKQIDLQLKALKSQLSPHFLFNSLNTISSLIFKDLSIAEDFIRKLAKSYQYTLTSYKKKWVTLQEELEFVKSYQYLLMTRFQDTLKFNIIIEDKFLDTKIPPLTIQMLVENAAKHNTINKNEMLNIEIGSDEKWIWVSNNKTSVPKKVSSHKIGLNNIRSRYQVLANKDVIIQNEDVFTVKLPIIR